MARDSNAQLAAEVARLTAEQKLQTRWLAGIALILAALLGLHWL